MLAYFVQFLAELVKAGQCRCWNILNKWLLLQNHSKSYVLFDKNILTKLICNINDFVFFLILHFQTLICCVFSLSSNFNFLKLSISSL